jgi:hypothetical protein
MTDRAEEPSGESHDSPVDEGLRWMEFACWAAIASLPILYGVHGAAVTTDQVVMRWILAIVVVVGAIGLRFRNRRV